MLELLSNTLQRTEQDCTALVEKLGKNATCLKVQANLDLRNEKKILLQKLLNQGHLVSLCHNLHRPVPHTVGE